MFLISCIGEFNFTNFPTYYLAQPIARFVSLVASLADLADEAGSNANLVVSIVL
jgi:hypothetical protein